MPRANRVFPWTNLFLNFLPPGSAVANFHNTSGWMKS